MRSKTFLAVMAMMLLVPALALAAAPQDLASAMEIPGGKIWWMGNVNGDGRTWARHEIAGGEEPRRGAYHTLYVGDLDGGGVEDRRPRAVLRHRGAGDQECGHGRGDRAGDSGLKPPRHRPLRSAVRGRRGKRSPVRIRAGTMERRRPRRKPPMEGDRNRVRGRPRCFSSAVPG